MHSLPSFKFFVLYNLVYCIIRFNFVCNLCIGWRDVKLILITDWLGKLYIRLIERK